MKFDTLRPLGRTGLKVTQVGFGAAPLGNMYEFLPEDQCRATVTAAWDAGVRLYDTAPLYGHGLSEHRLGEALRWRPRGEWVLSTKIGRTLHPQDPARVDGALFKGVLPFEYRFDYSYDGVMRSIEGSLQRLGTHRIDVLLIHDVDIWTHGSKDASDARIEEVMTGGYQAMVKLRDEGVVKAIGAGVNEWQICETLAKRGDFDCFLLAGRYTLLEQESLVTFLPLCQERGISIIIGGPLNTGILATGAVPGAYYNYKPAPPEVMDRVARIEAVCKRHGVPLAAAALQFPLHHPAVSAIIPGARRPDEITRNAATFAQAIPADLWGELKAEGLLHARAPTP